MAKCWTCGTHVSGYRYTCSSCESLNEIKNLQKIVKSYGNGLDYTAQIQQEGFEALKDTLSSGLSEIASAIEWGFGEISWQLQQQTDVLRSIDHTLKTPSETKANEWRLHAEELRRRGVLEESEEFFLKALNEYLLDYRIYVGLAETYLQMDKFDKAKVFLEKSLPHAPKKEIDYKSYSYRLIGHIYACEEDFNQALDALHSSIKLSPNYADGLYDFAQYASLVNDDVVDRICLQTFQEWGGNWALKDYNFVRLLCLQKAIKDKPVYFYLAEKERNFEPRRNTVQLALKNLLDNAHGRVETIIAKINTISEEVDRAVSKATEALNKSRDKNELESNRIYENAKSKLKLANEKLVSGDYMALLDAQPIAEEAYNLMNAAKDKAYKDREHYEKRRSEKVKNAWKRVPGLIWIPIVWGIIGSILGSICRWAYLASGKGQISRATDNFVISIFILIGLVIGFINAIYNIKKQLE